MNLWQPAAIHILSLTLSSALLAGCATDGPTAPDGQSATLVPSPPPTPAAAPSPAPGPSPSPSPTPPANRPPAVSLTGGGACHPSPGQPCSVTFAAKATDPDGDRLSYSWGGCGRGGRDTSACLVAAPGPQTVTVSVSDGRGGIATATASANGINAAPVIRLPRPPDPAPSDTRYSFAGHQPEDPDGDELPNDLCTRLVLTVTGACTAGPPACGGVGDVFDIDLHTTTGLGTCVLEVRVSDSWGAVGKDRVAFQVSAP